MEVGYVQFNPQLGAVEANLERMKALTKGVSADLLVFPELATTGYAIPDTQTGLQWGHSLEGEAIFTFRDIAREIGGQIVVGIAEVGGSKLYNSSILVGPSGIHGVYRKAHLFGNEKAVFSPGNTGFWVNAAPKAKVGMMVCFDWAFPEAAGSLARRGAEVIAHPSNLVLPYAGRAMPIRCIENRVFAVMSNRWGEEPTPDGPLSFNGESMIISPVGDLVAKGPQVGDHVQIVTIDPTRARDKLITAQNHLFEDRREDLYAQNSR